MKRTKKMSVPVLRAHVTRTTNRLTKAAKREANKKLHNWSSLDDLRSQMDVVEKPVVDEKRALSIMEAKPKLGRKKNRNINRKTWTPAVGCPKIGCDSDRFKAVYSHVAPLYGRTFKVRCCKCDAYVKFVQEDVALKLIELGLIEPSFSTLLQGDTASQTAVETTPSM